MTSINVKKKLEKFNLINTLRQIVFFQYSILYKKVSSLFISMAKWAIYAKENDSRKHCH